MKRSYLAIISGSILLVIFALSWCGRNPKPVFTGVPVQPENASPTPVVRNPLASVPPTSPSPSPSSGTDFRKVAEHVSPAVILISVFDDPGKLLRTATGFFISEDGKFVTSRHFVEDGAHGVAKTSAGGIYNVSGTLSDGGALGVAIMQAEVKNKVPFLTSGKAAGANPGTRVAVIASPLARGAAAFVEATVAAQKSDQSGEWLELSSAPPNEMIGAAVVNENGELLGIVTPPMGQANGANIVRNAGAVDLLVAKIQTDAKARWQAAGGSPSPTATATGSVTPPPKMVTETTIRTEKPRIIYNPKPSYPSYSYFHEKGSGNFRITFSATGQARNVEVVQSTGSQTLDNVTVETLRRWKAAAGQEWSVKVPITFERR